MNRNTKIIIGIIASAVVLCACLGGVGFFTLRYVGQTLEEKMMVTDPEQVALVAKETIADYDLPPNYHEGQIIDTFVAKYFSILPDGHGGGNKATAPIFMLATVPSGLKLSEEELGTLWDGMDKTLGKQGLELEYADEKTMIIRNQEVLLTIYEGTDSDGERVRVVISGFFEGKESPISILIASTVDTWDQKMIDTFLQSIR